MAQAGEMFYRDVHADADELYATWKHLADDDCLEQVDAHLESANYTASQREDAIERIFFPFDYFQTN